MSKKYISEEEWERELDRRAEIEQGERIERLAKAAAIQEWTDWAPGKPLPKPIRHWTGEGTIEILPEPGTFSLLAVVRVEGRQIASYISPDTAALDLFAGKHDAALGFSPRAVGVPESFIWWSGLR
jgi:hypothetical protein